MKKKRAIVTGGAGFIGSHMVDLLIKKNFHVTVIDNFIGGHKNNIKHHLKNKNFKLVKLDICKIDKNKYNFFKNIDYVYHFAGIGDIVPSIEKPSEYMNVNVQGTVRVLEASRKAKVKKFVYAASASCYGLNNSEIDEKTKISIEHPYALSKHLGEKAAIHWGKVYKIPVNVIRIFNAYGTRVRTTGAYGAVFGVFFKQKIKNKPLTVVGDGNQERDFVYVTDVANAFYLASMTKKSGNIYNVGTGSPQKIITLAKLIGGKINYIPFRPGEPIKSKANVRKIKRELKWKPQVSFEVGVNKMMKEIHKWKSAPLWTPNKIKKATTVWFKFMGKK
ncbi:MAG: NAD-dependent epimerase/dehydratase family protein [Pseudomonadota bacterium]|nr:NAD-dependent epimerase/dehydratase family protein [Pseudomonadota bacterium]